VLEGGIERGFCHGHAQVGQGFGKGWCGFVVIYAGAHCLSSFICGISNAMGQIYAVHDIVKRHKNHEMR
jgi:hypothetical protein